MEVTNISVAQESTIGPTLFDIDINGLFHFIKDTEISHSANAKAVNVCDRQLKKNSKVI